MAANLVKSGFNVRGFDFRCSGIAHPPHSTHARHFVQRGRYGQAAGGRGLCRCLRQRVRCGRRLCGDDAAVQRDRWWQLRPSNRAACVACRPHVSPSRLHLPLAVLKTYADISGSIKRGALLVDSSTGASLCLPLRPSLPSAAFASCFISIVLAAFAHFDAAHLHHSYHLPFTCSRSRRFSHCGRAGAPNA